MVWFPISTIGERKLKSISPSLLDRKLAADRERGRRQNENVISHYSYFFLSLLSDGKSRRPWRISHATIMNTPPARDLTKKKTPVRTPFLPILLGRRRRRRRQESTMRRFPKKISEKGKEFNVPSSQLFSAEAVKFFPFIFRQNEEGRKEGRTTLNESKARPDPGYFQCEFWNLATHRTFLPRLIFSNNFKQTAGRTADAWNRNIGNTLQKRIVPTPQLRIMGRITSDRQMEKKNPSLVFRRVPPTFDFPAKLLRQIKTFRRSCPPLSWRVGWGQNHPKMVATVFNYFCIFPTAAFLCLDSSANF